MSSVRSSVQDMEHNGRHGFFFHIESEATGVELMIFMPVNDDIAETINNIQQIGEQLSKIILTTMDGGENGSGI